jgi:peptidoglycan hydrolase CwlO-like protein
VRYLDNEILDILKELKYKITCMDDKITGLEEGQKRLEKKLDGVVEQTADLLEFRSSITEKVDSIRKDLGKVEIVTSKNCFEIAYLEAVK